MSSDNAEATSISAANLKEALERGDIDASTQSGEFFNSEVADAVLFRESIDPEFGGDRLREVIGYRERSQNIAEAVKEGCISQMQFGTGFVENKKDEKEALPLFVSVLEKGAGMIYIWGGQEAGKTHTATWVGDKALKYVEDIDTVVTNIPLESRHVDVDISPSSTVALELDGNEVDTPADMGRVNRDRRDVCILVDSNDRTSDVLEGEVIRVGKETHMRKVCAVVPGRVVELLDEWGTKGGGHKGSNPNAGEYMTRHFKEMRHRPFRAVAGIVGHSPTDLEKDARKLLDMAIKKTTPTIGRMFSGLSRKGGQDFITDVKVGSHGLDGYDDEGATRWEFDAQKSDQEDEGDQEEDGQLKMVAQNMRNDGETVRDIADKVDRSTWWVSEHTDAPD